MGALAELVLSQFPQSLDGLLQGLFLRLSRKHHVGGVPELGCRGHLAVCRT